MPTYVISGIRSNGEQSFYGIDSASGYPYWSSSSPAGKVYYTLNDAQKAIQGISGAEISSEKLQGVNICEIKFNTVLPEVRQLTMSANDILSAISAYYANKYPESVAKVIIENDKINVVFNRPKPKSKDLKLEELRRMMPGMHPRTELELQQPNGLFRLPTDDEWHDDCAMGWTDNRRNEGMSEVDIKKLRQSY